MGGSYPRTENDIIEKEKLEIAENNQKYIDSMKDSVGPVTGELRRELTPSHSNLRLPRGVVRAERAAKPEIVEVPVYGQVDVSQIDSIRITPATPEQARAAGLNPNSMDRPEMYNLMAKLEIMNPKNRLPNFDKFSQREDMIGRSRPEQVKEYLDLRQGLVHRAAIELQTEINIDISALSDPVKLKTLLSDPSIVQTFSKVKDIGVSPDYFKGVVLIDMEGQGGGRETERVREEMRADLAAGSPTKAAYNSDDQKIYINQDLCTSAFLRKGGLAHEWIHPRLLQENGDVARALNLRDNHPAHKVIKSCEEAVANIRTYKLIGEEHNELLYERYGINPSDLNTSAKNILNRMFPKGAHPFREQMAEVMATFKATEPRVFDQIKLTLEAEKSSIGNQDVNRTYSLADDFYSAVEVSGQDFKDKIISSIGLMGYRLPDSNKDYKPRFKKFSSFTLEERI